MTIKVLKSLKYIGLLSTVLFATISCEKEIENIGVNLIDNNFFSTNKLTSDVITTNVNIDKVPANGISQYLLGVYTDPEFGKLEASIVSQLTLPAIGESYTYGTNAAIDSVLIQIPYQSTKVENYENGKPKFTIDSVFGDADIEFQLNILELKTFLNTLDPNDPTKPAIYYSDKEFLKGDTPLFSGNFKVNPNDTVAYIKRYMPDGITVYDRDTIKLDGLIPSPTIKIPLNESMIQQLFVDNAGGTEFLTIDNFQHYFRGLYIEAKESEDANSHIVSLDMTNSKMTIFYSNDEDEGTDTTDAGIDLNGNGIKGEGIVRMKHKYDFSLNSIKSNVLKRDYTVSKQSGNERLYVQGAAGSLSTIELLNAENLVDLQTNNWLITDANLIFYVDQSALSNIAPEQLFLYNYDENQQILDIMTEGLTALGGNLEKDEAGKPYRYVFKITDYISELLKKLKPGEERSVSLVKLGLKVYNSTDSPSSFVDTKVKEYNWNPKGVVLYGNDISAGDKKIKLEISYTEINN